MQATNTLIAFRPSDAHGSSLLHRNPADDAWYSGNYQMGLAIVSSPRLVSAFTTYKKNQLKEEDVLDILEEEESDVEYEWDSSSGTESDSDSDSSYRP